MKYIACIGNFDGVHLGHQQLINRCKELAGERFQTAAITFDPDPATVYGKETDRKAICTIEQKKELFYNFGIDEVIVIPFNKDIALITKDKFIEYFLNNFNLDTLVCGPDFTFGHRGEGNSEALLKYSKKNFKVDIVGFLKYRDEKISSTMIRNLIKQGEIQLANQLLGYTYSPLISVKAGKIYSDNILPDLDEYDILIDGWQLKVKNNTIDYKDCQDKQIRFI